MNRFERLRQGEAVDALLAEAEEANTAARAISLRTRQVPGTASSKKKSKARAAPAA